MVLAVSVVGQVQFLGSAYIALSSAAAKKIAIVLLAYWKPELN